MERKNMQDDFIIMCAVGFIVIAFISYIFVFGGL